MNFGERLKGLRTDKGLTQPQLAQLAGIEQSYLSKLENDKSVPSAEMFATILAGLGVDEAAFMQELDREALDSLRHIPVVANYTMKETAVQDGQTKRWLYGSGLAWILGFAMMLAAKDGIFTSNARYTYQSPGVILAGEPENVFDTRAMILGYQVGAGIITAPEMSKQLAEFHAQRSRPLTVEQSASRGESYMEAVDGGQRRFGLVRTSQVKATGNRILEFIGAIVLVSGFIGLFIEWRLRRIKSGRR